MYEISPGWRRFRCPRLQMDKVRPRKCQSLVQGHGVREAAEPGLELRLQSGVLALVTPCPPACMFSFFPLLFMNTLGPQPTWLPPAISPYHCSGSQPCAPQRQRPRGPHGRGWRAGGGASVVVARATLSWSGLFSLLPAASATPGGAEWAEVAGPGASLLPAPA